MILINWRNTQTCKVQYYIEKCEVLDLGKIISYMEYQEQLSEQHLIKSENTAIKKLNQNQHYPIITRSVTFYATHLKQSSYFIQHSWHPVKKSSLATGKNLKETIRVTGGLENNNLLILGKIEIVHLLIQRNKLLKSDLKKTLKYVGSSCKKRW